MNKKLLGALFSIITLAILVAPVMAMGPLKALEVGKNPNLDGFVPFGFVMLDDVGVANNVFWFNGRGEIGLGNDVSKGGGKMNNAIIADYAIVLDMQANPEEYENKWIYLSGTGGEQYGGHGMAYWVLVNYFGPVAAAGLEAEYSDGVFFKVNSVGK
ncbi:hypothetical protein AC477_03850 [miscellaneous Crenarchaeota group-1 archaeon SG8-32-1]|uniref:Uncharacterized protein n=1 Tax=miscellaneous Crenarchaeota group-1 archaeon SG8-32-1 TaxID=1685124 RepID=A0A0M0BTU2_9ARCH|nr:MAG: hypothetical protein AC477_03850 [miscellaneous Crenarchaeota group-1 archaeon SG8-32-1]